MSDRAIHVIVANHLAHPIQRREDGSAPGAQPGIALAEEPHETFPGLVCQFVLREGGKARARRLVARGISERDTESVGRLLWVPGDEVGILDQE